MSFSTLLAWSVAVVVCASTIRWQIAEWKLRKHTRLVAESRRGLFRFSDGIRIRAVDPIAVILSMEEHPDFRFDIHPKRVEKEGELEATTIMVDAIRKAFAVPEFTSPKLPGLTVQECLQLYDAFCRYVDQQKKSTESSQTSRRSTDATSSESEATITPDMSDCGLIAQGPRPSTA